MKLDDRLDAVAIKMGITKDELITTAVKNFIENHEYNEKLEDGCGEEHQCSFCTEVFKCYYFCGQSMYRECRKCLVKRLNVDTTKSDELR